ncbi:MAG: hypothetical protein KFF68_08400 [Desulfosarcina sp.]|nr:hypothetical protein [Desulfosarcina sp.]
MACVVVPGNPDGGDAALIERVGAQLVDWFGRQAGNWDHLQTFRISHALPDQSPPTRNPTCPDPWVRPGVFVCGEHGSLPGIQWAMVSRRLAAEAVLTHLSDFLI